MQLVLGWYANYKLQKSIRNVNIDYYWATAEIFFRKSNHDRIINDWSEVDVAAAVSEILSRSLADLNDFSRSEIIQGSQREAIQSTTGRQI